jgi:hypothetical protein
MTNATNGLDPDLEDAIAAAAEEYADEHLGFLLEEARRRLALPADAPESTLFERLVAPDAHDTLLSPYPRHDRPRRHVYAARLARLREDRAVRLAAAAINVHAHAHASSRGVPPRAAELLAGLALIQLAATDAADDASRPGPWSWRRWKLTSTLDRWGYALGVHAGAGWRMEATGSWDTITWRAFRWTRRPYALGWPIEKWRCLLRYRHWPHWPGGSPVALGMCGRCCPWPCCGSIEQDHADDCTDPTYRC